MGWIPRILSNSQMGWRKLRGCPGWSSLILLTLIDSTFRGFQPYLDMETSAVKAYALQIIYGFCPPAQEEQRESETKNHTQWGKKSRGLLLWQFWSGNCASHDQGGQPETLPTVSKDRQISQPLCCCCCCFGEGKLQTFVQVVARCQQWLKGNLIWPIQIKSSVFKLWSDWSIFSLARQFKKAVKHKLRNYLKVWEFSRNPLFTVLDYGL